MLWSWAGEMPAGKLEKKFKSGENKKKYHLNVLNALKTYLLKLKSRSFSVICYCLRVNEGEQHELGKYWKSS